jgi:rare lipoprotein A
MERRQAVTGDLRLMSLPFRLRRASSEPRSGDQSRAIRSKGLVALAGLAALAFGGCAQQQQIAAGHSSEYFPQSIYGAASPRVLADGAPVPHGGGKYLVGRPYMVAGHMYYPRERTHFVQVGLASWYGAAFHGRRTANGEIFDRNSISAAHPTLPLPCYVRVTNLRNHYSMVVRVNDRGPFEPGRIMDVSRRVADLLDFRRGGTTLVKVEYLGHASLDGSNDEKLASTLRIDDHSAPAGFPSMLADADQPIQTASADPSEMPQTARPVEQAQSRDGQTGADASLPTSRIFVGTAPLPPARPFDLDTIPGAGVPIGETASR